MIDFICLAEVKPLSQLAQLIVESVVDEEYGQVLHGQEYRQTEFLEPKSQIIYIHIHTQRQAKEDCFKK